ncbi:MAG: helix-turn-helix transcriptional regulator [Chloroflexota bacterium]|nr:helix-turn-helix transcriptional regulator [Chloroflexota bacterium]
MVKDLQMIRKHKRMSINQLASKSGISTATLIQYEKGEQEIAPTDLRQLAKALYVDEWDINPRSSPPPTPPRKERPAEIPRPQKKPPREKKPPPKPLPARDTQISHLLTIAARFDVDRAALEAEIGKPLEELTQKEARFWNNHYMRRMAEEQPPKHPVDRKRAYLPEGIDGFELAYLQEQQEAGAPLHFTLFDSQTFEGAVVGFSPYQITIRATDGDEITLNKLAIAYYRKAGGVAGGVR